VQGEAAVLPTILPLQHRQGAAPSLVGFSADRPMMVRRIRIDFAGSVLERLAEA